MSGVRYRKSRLPRRPARMIRLWRGMTCAWVLRQGGFSLVEMIVAVAMLGILAAAAMSAFSGSEQSKTAALMSKMQEIANAVSMYQRNTGCVPNNVSVLFDKLLATAANNFCAVSTQANYGNQDYLSPMPGDGGKGVLLNQLGVENGDLLIRQNLTGTTPNNYAIEVINPGDALYPLLAACNGVDYAGVATGNLPHDFVNGAACVYVAADNSVGMLISRY